MEHVRDTVVRFAPDSASVAALLECDSLNRVVMRRLEQRDGSRIKPETVFHQPVMADTDNAGGLAVLTVLCLEDSLEAVIQVREREIQELRERRETITKEVEKPLSHWQSFVLVLGYIALGTIALTIIAAVAKLALRSYGIKL